MLSSLNEKLSLDKILLGVLLTFNVNSGLSLVYEDVTAGLIVLMPVRASLTPRLEARLQAPPHR